MSKLVISSLAALLCFTAVSCEVKERFQPNWKSLDTRVSPKWYDQVKIGIFLHWGVFSVPSYESAWFWKYWTENTPARTYMEKNYRPNFLYADFAKDFTAELYEPDRWAELFEASGAKYMALTSKHHEGFCNWNTKYSFNWNSMDVGPKRDLVGELAAAVKKRGTVRFGLYHSWYEWFNPLYEQDKANGYKTHDFIYAKPMPCLYEIINNYQPEFIWSDGDWEANSTYWNSTEFLAWLFNDSPVKDTVIVNDRWGKDAWCKHGDTFNCNDRFNPGVLQPHKWENAMSLDKTAWTFRRDANYSDFYEIEEFLAELVRTISCGGNLLVNIGPRKDGTIPVIMEERLRQMGAWLKINGEAIYDTVPWLYQNDTDNGNVWYTQNKAKGTVYALLVTWPNDHNVYMQDPRLSRDSTVELIGYPGQLRFIPDPSGASGVEVLLPYLPPSSKLRWAWALKFTKLLNTEAEARKPSYAHMYQEDSELSGTHTLDFGVKPKDTRSEKVTTEGPEIEANEGLSEDEVVKFMMEEKPKKKVRKNDELFN